MRIKLDFDDRLAFSTVELPLSMPMAGPHRTLVVKVGGKAFSVWRTVDPMELAWHSNDYMREIDMALVAAMERMLSKVFTDACAAVPEGAELL